MNSIWWARNSTIFHGKLILDEVVSWIIESTCKSYKLETKRKILRVSISLAIKLEILWGFFAGASQGTPLLCVVRAILLTNKHHFLHIIY